ncbi:MAG: winged helix-turn-helix domain-containing protein [Kiloniellales bacterium]
MTRSVLTVLVDFGPAGGFGPGKAQLLERIEEAGSIAAAARAMGMSYRRAWLMVASMNRCFARAVVETSHGGRQGGGARVTDSGRQVVALYRSVERAARRAAMPHLARLRQTVAS